jgi:aryl-alcohol dehydrogenase-like predicted oxidoreductase
MSSTQPISTRSLGKTGIQVTPIGLGVMELSGGGGMLGMAFPVISKADKNAIIQTALDGGINWFDTAEIYGAGVSERSLADGLKAAGKRPGDVVVATKWFPLFRTAGNIPHTISNRIRFLEGYPIDLYYVHNPSSFSSPEAEMNAMADLAEAGKIRSVGVSNFGPERMRRAHAALQKRGLPLAANQVRYSLLYRRIEIDGTLETAKELGVTITAYTPLASGLLSGKYHKNPELLKSKPFFWRARIQRQLEASRPLVAVLEEIAAKYQATAAQVALNWLIYFNGEIVVTIPGATKASQAAESAAAMKFKLSDAELARLDELSRSFR